jgi:methylglyoxal synthase
VVWNVPVACNRASADYMISSPLLAAEPGSPPAAPAPLSAA